MSDDCARVLYEVRPIYLINSQLPYVAPCFSVWCRRTDELVDGPNASQITPTALDRWESRLEELFQGRPFDMLDAALADTVAKFPVDIQVWILFLDQIRYWLEIHC